MIIILLVLGASASLLGVGTSLQPPSQTHTSSSHQGAPFVPMVSTTPEPGLCPSLVVSLLLGSSSPKFQMEK